MKSGNVLILAALAILLTVTLWGIRGHNPAPALAMVTPSWPTIVTAPAIPAAPIAPAPIEQPVAQPVVPPALSVVAVPAAVPKKSPPILHVDSSGDVQYTARPGDTVSQLAIALFGTDSRDHRDTVIAANASLQSNPDLVLAGQSYSRDPSSDQVDVNAKPDHASTPKAPPSTAKDPSTVKPVLEDRTAIAPAGPTMKYSAQPGDTVRVLASTLLGADTKENRDAIISPNASLRQDPDHMVAGKTYNIVAPNGLAADPNPATPPALSVQPDADDVVRQAAGRVLRYTAKSGDTVSKLAVALLGEDSPAHRDLIIQNNPTLKQDPDHLTIGQTYWITAPAADPKL